MELVDYYQGFEGEWEFVISRKGSDGVLLAQIKLWSGYFDDLMEQIPPGESGDWEGVLKYYHSRVHRIESTEWECTDIQGFIDQLSAIDPSKFRLGSGFVLDAVLDLAKKCVETDGHLFILED